MAATQEELTSVGVSRLKAAFGDRTILLTMTSASADPRPHVIAHEIAKAEDHENDEIEVSGLFMKLLLEEYGRNMGFRTLVDGVMLNDTSATRMALDWSDTAAAGTVLLEDIDAYEARNVVEAIGAMCDTLRYHSHGTVVSAELAITALNIVRLIADRKITFKITSKLKSAGAVPQWVEDYMRDKS